MLQTIKLLLPALMPSWRFFAAIAPSPRIELALLKTAEASPGTWKEFRPRPERLSLVSMLKRMLYNPEWNETLYLVRCAELYTSDPTQHSIREILERIKSELERTSFDPEETPYLQFRIIFVQRNGVKLEKLVTYTSPVHPSYGGAAS